MNKTVWTTLVACALATFSPPAPAQRANEREPAANPAGQNQRRVRAREDWQPARRDAHTTEWISVERVKDPLPGRVREVPHKYIELATGLNRRSETGRWVAADPSFEITDRGAEARGTVHHVLLAPDINSAGPIQVEKNGAVLKSHPLCIAYYDPVDGRSVALAEIKSAPGWLTAPHEVVYSNCFTGLRASIRVRNTRAGVATDLLLHERPALTPEEMGFSPETRLELFTELSPDSPAPPDSRTNDTARA